MPRSVAGGERLDAMRGADELRHDGEAAQHEHHVEHARSECQMAPAAMLVPTMENGHAQA